MLKQMQLSKTEREREVCVGPEPSVEVARHVGAGAGPIVPPDRPPPRPRAVGTRVFAVTWSQLSELGQEETVKEEREVRNLAWKPRGKVDCGSGGITRTPTGRPSGGLWFQLGTNPGSVGQRLLPSMLTLPREVWRPAVVSPVAPPALPPGSAHSRPEHRIPFGGGHQDPSPFHARQSADDLDEGEADRREVEEQRDQHVRVQRPLQPEAVSGNLGARVAGPTSPCCL